MIRDVRWAASALDDLNSVVTYIAQDNPFAALSVVEKIEKSGVALGQFATGRKGRVHGTYEKPIVGLDYIVAYMIERRLDGSECVMILRVIHGARDWPPEQWPKGK